MTFSAEETCSVRRPEEQKYHLFFWGGFLTQQLHLTVMKFYQQETWDTISSSQTPLFLRTSATNLLNQHITVISSVIIFTMIQSWPKEVVHVFKSAGHMTIHWQIILFAFFLSMYGRKERSVQDYFFGAAANMIPCLFPQTFCFPVLSRNLLKYHTN